MTPPELAVALRKLAAKAATTDGLKLLALANSFDRPFRTTTSTDPRARRAVVVEFRAGGKAYRTRPERERRAGLGLAGL